MHISKRTIVTLIDDDEVFHFIPVLNGELPDCYIMVRDDAHNMDTGKTKILSDKQIKRDFNIDIKELEATFFKTANEKRAESIEIPRLNDDYKQDAMI